MLGLYLLLPLGIQAQPALTLQSNASFAKVLQDSNSGTQVLSPLGSCSTTGGATLFGGTPTALSLQVSGNPGSAFTLQGFPAALTLSGRR